jgi:NAD(P)-dependent dehydrogenase (short-subunit alcohol dehydrogenase family)
MIGTPSRLQRVALVTGSSRGLGSAIARRLAQDVLAVHVVTTARATRPGLNPTPRET